MEKSTISVVIPTYNVEKYMSECLESLIHQEFKDIEIICVDDGSSDRTVDIIEKYQKLDTRIKLYRNKHEGASKSRNIGTDISSGKYLMFIDSDDMLSDDNALKIMAEEMEKYELDILLYDGESFFENNDLFMKNQHSVNWYKRKKEYGLYDNLYMLILEMINNGDTFITPCMKIIKKDVLIKEGIRFHEGIIYEDNLFMFDLANRFGRAKHIKKSLYRRRVRSNSVMQKPITELNMESAWTIYTILLNHRSRDLSYEQMVILDYYIKSIFRIMEKIYSNFSSNEQLLVDLRLSNAYRNIKNGLYHYIKKLEDMYSGKVVIYGAGNRGRAYYKLAREEGLRNIVGIVDKKSAEIRKYFLDVSSVDNINKFNYDYIWISISNTNVAMEVRRYLITKGVEPDKIVCI